MSSRDRRRLTSRSWTARSALRLGTAAIAALVLLCPAEKPARAADLVIALKNSPPTMDPHFMTSPSVAQLTSLVFEPIVARDENNKMQPKLAESWQMPNDTTWEFKLRKDVKFHDGTPFTAHDVVFTYGRARNVPNALSSFATYLLQVGRAEAIDDHTLRITTTVPAPTLLDNLSTVLIVSKKMGEGATTDDYNAGKTMNGTGPYRFVSWAFNDKNIFEANPNYWGNKPKWDKLTYRILHSDSTRLAALLAGDVDVIEEVPADEIGWLRHSASVSLWTRETNRIAYLAMDVHPEALSTGRVAGLDGETLNTNPLADPRVREAMKFAIDLEGLVATIYRNEAVANGQFIAASNHAYNLNLPPWKADPERARKLLADSGWEGKFRLELVVAASLFQNSVKVAEAIAHAWTRIGVPTKLTRLPFPAYADQRAKRGFAVALHSFQNQSGSAELLFPALLHTREGSYGALNFTRYSNKQLDKLIEEANATTDHGRRAKMLQDAMTIAAKDATIIPLWLMSDTTGTKKSLTYRPRLDRYLAPDNVGMAGD